MNTLTPTNTTKTTRNVLAAAGSPVLAGSLSASLPPAQHMAGVLDRVALVPAICPKAPPGVQAHYDSVAGNVMWGVVALFLIGVLISIGAIVLGRIFSMPHVSKGGVIGLAVIVGCAICYVVFPGIVSGILGTGCV